MQRPKRLVLSYKVIVNLVGRMLIGLAGFMLIPIGVALFYPAEVRWVSPFIYAAVLSAAFGGLLVWKFPQRNNVGLNLEEGGVLVVLIWAATIVLSALPFYFGGQLGWSHAVYESVSGWTTTGLSVMDVAVTPRIYLFWRSLMQLGGGAGLAVMMLASIIGPQGLGLYRAEGRSDQLLPHVRRSTSLILKIYAGYILVGIVAYTLAGMSVFDAINHAFCALSTGGFSTRAESIGAYNNLLIEAVTVVLMLAGGTNFASHFVLLQGRLRTFFRQGETRLVIGMLFLAIPAISLLTLFPVLGTVPEAWRHGVFQVVTALSTTGYATVGYEAWNDFGVLLLILLMLIGGGVGSTAGGIKQYRVFLMLKSIVWELQAHRLPQRVIRRNYIWRGEHKHYIDSGALKEAAFYIFVYIATYFAGVLVFLVSGYPLRESMFEFASALGTVGLSIGITGPDMPAAILWTEIAGMTLGRLEFFVIFYSLSKVIRDALVVRQT